MKIDTGYSSLGNNYGCRRLQPLLLKRGISHPGSIRVQRGNGTPGCLCSVLETCCRKRRCCRTLRRVQQYQWRCKARPLAWPDCSR